MKKLKYYFLFAITFFKCAYEKVLFRNNIIFACNSVVPLNAIISTTDNSTIEIGRHVNVRKGAKLSARGNGRIVIGNGVSLNYNAILCAYEKITIGDGTIIGPNVCMYDQDHDYTVAGGVSTGKYKTGAINIGKNVWIGAGVIILRNTVIGDNTVIGAGSVVKGVIPDNCLYYQKKECIVKEICKIQ